MPAYTIIFLVKEIQTVLQFFAKDFNIRVNPCHPCSMGSGEFYSNSPIAHKIPRFIISNASGTSKSFAT